MNHYFQSYHRALADGFTHFAASIAALFQQQYHCDINEAYGRACRNGTAYNHENCRPFMRNCGPSGAPDL